MFSVCFFRNYKKEYNYKQLVEWFANMYEQKGKTLWRYVDMVKALSIKVKMDDGPPVSQWRAVNARHCTVRLERKYRRN